MKAVQNQIKYFVYMTTPCMSYSRCYYSIYTPLLYYDILHQVSFLYCNILTVSFYNSDYSLNQLYYYQYSET